MNIFRIIFHLSTKYFYPFQRMTKNNKITQSSFGKNIEKLEFSYTADEKKWHCEITIKHNLALTYSQNNYAE